MKFNELNLSNELLRAINDCGYNEATYIQSACIPVVLNGGDIIGQSQTGTGKTAAFGIPIVETIQVNERKKKPQVLILSPTRELALQVCEEIRKFAKYKEGIRTVCIYGGTPIMKQIQDLKRGADIVVGCPGRILDHVNRKTLRFDECTKLVLDEADEMLNMGFREDIEEIMKYLPEERQTILFSATMPKPILEITKQYQTNPVHIKTPTQNMSPSKISQIVYECNQSAKREVLVQLIELMRPKLAMVFCNTKKMVDDLTSDLVAKGYPAAAIHGDMKQEARANVMERFKAHKINILIATDVAARGIDVDNMDVVYNFDFPQEVEYYVHRIGRTGRAGKEGVAITLLTPRQKNLIRELERITHSTIDKRPLPTSEVIKEVRLAQIQMDIENMLSKPIHKDIDAILEGFRETGRTDREIADALATHIFASSLMEPVKAKTAPTKFSSSTDKVSIEINVGKRHQIAPAHLVSAIAEATGISGKDIGKIRIEESTSTIDVPSEFSKEIVNQLKNIKIKGYAIKVNQVSESKKDYARLPKKDRSKPSRSNSKEDKKGGRGSRDRNHSSKDSKRRSPNKKHKS